MVLPKKLVLLKKGRDGMILNRKLKSVPSLKGRKAYERGRMLVFTKANKVSNRF